MVQEKDLQQFSAQCKKIYEEIGRDVIGQKEVVEYTVIAMIAGGNVLLEGVPGVGKTRLVRTLGAFSTFRFPVSSLPPTLCLRT